MMDITGWVLSTDCAGISTCSPVAEVKRTASESPYTIAVAMTLRRGAIARELTKFQAIVGLLCCWRGYRDGLANRDRDCARTIAVVAELLLPTRAPPPIARGFSSQLPERCGEGGFGGIAKRRRHRHDRSIRVAQHVHCLLEPVLAQPGMRRKPGAFLEGTAEVEARQAGLRSETRERDVRIAVRTQAFDRAKQRLRRQPALDRLDRGWRAGVRSQETRGQEFCQLLPEQRIQGLIALHDIGRAQE